MIRPKQTQSAFTLIELLIVVAIIAILAAIAVPNFLEAQTRSKVSRVKADMRSIATAIESYMTDYNHFPFDYAEDVNFPYYLHRGITTPIAYMTDAARMRDAFGDKVEIADNREVRRRFRYRALGEKWMCSKADGGLGLWNISYTTPGMVKGREVHGSWLLVSKGPWGKLNLPRNLAFADGNNETDWLWLPYDPTNGTRSPGEVMRSQKNPEVRGYDMYATEYTVN
jgi:prepilin-type N-terminal cleavage/methylation domain-containing protein